MPWDPDQYLKFKEQRFAPFADLCAFITKRDHLSVIDLGCGTGELTRRMTDSLTASSVIGIDSSERMLEHTAAFATDGLSFSRRAVEEVNGSWDLVISNAVMQWVDAIAEVAESMDHHPDIDVRWVKLRVSVMTHDKGGLTALDFELADRVDAICT